MQAAAEVVSRTEAGDIRPLVAETYVLKDLARAQEAFLQRGHIGKIGIRVAAE